MRRAFIVSGPLALVFVFVVAASVASSACGGSVRDDSASAAALGASALAGTWDLTATPTSHTATTSGSLVIERSTVRFTLGASTLTLEGSGAAVVLTSTRRVDVTHESEALDTGALPLDVGGVWSATSPDGAQQCHARLTTTELSGACTEIDTGDWGVGLHGSVSGTRVRTLASSFGDLGGQWLITQGETTCNALFEGTDLNVTCTRDGVRTGSLSVHVTDSIASGTASNGLELAARRRNAVE